MWMTRRKLLQVVDVEKVREAIHAAEQTTSAEIRVAVSGPFWGSVERAARAAFRRLSMTSTAARNGVLIFVAPARRRFVVLGDVEVHARVGQSLWDRVVPVIADKFRRSDFTGGLLGGIASLAEGLSGPFPYDPRTDRNELADEVDV
jgi:uncharacterized membrane protein